MIWRRAMRGICRSRLAAHGVALALLLLPAAASAAEDTIRIRAGAHDGFARMAFDGESPDGFRATLDGLDLVIDLTKGVDPNFRPIHRQLYRYVRHVAAAPGGRRLTMRLTRPVRLAQRRIDGVVALDLIDLDPAAGGDAATEKPAEQETVRLRAGEHDGFSRLVFDWRRNVTYRVSEQDGQVSIAFARRVRIDAKPARRDNPPQVKGISVQRDAAGTRVDLAVPSGVRVRHFRDGTKIVLDILTAGANAPKVAAKAPKKTADGPPVPLLKKSPDGPPAVKLEPVDAAPAAEPKPAAPAAQVAAEAAPDAGRLRVGINETSESIQLAFPWPEPVAAATFERSGFLWVVFDAPTMADLRGVGGGESGILAAQQIGHRRATILRLKIRNGLFPTMRRERATWLLRLSTGAGGASAQIPAVPQSNAVGGARVFLPVIDTGRRVRIYDPEVGDELTVVPVLPSGHGVPVAQEFAEFRALPTAQGVVVRAFIDDLEVTPRRNGVAIGNGRGLVLSSPEVVEQTRNTRMFAASVKGLLIDYRGWRAPAETGFVAQKQALQRDLAQASKAERNDARWAYARLLFAHNQVADTLALLTMMEADDPELPKRPDFRAVRGVTLLLSNRPDPAAKDLLHADLNRYADVGVWRGLIYLGMEKYEEANREFAAGAEAIQTLPQELAERVLIGWSQAALEADDLTSFRVAVGQLEAFADSRRAASYASLMRGRAAERDEEPELALEHYQAAIAEDYRPTRARAALAKVEVELGLEQIEAVDAIERLESLRFAWRGDSYELELMQRLSDMHIANGDYREALETLRQAVTHFPDSKDARSLAQLMNTIFDDLFLNGAANKLDPVRSLALYYDFQELTPVGKRGDEMIRRLADRLVQVDLLDRAARLLDHQVNFRLKGGEKARVAARLAIIHLLNKSPAEALAVLDASKFGVLSDELSKERRYLRIRALVELNRTTEALESIAGDNSEPAQLLRADIHWRNQDWAAAAKTMQGLLAGRARKDLPLSASEQNRVIQTAISLYMADDFKGLDKLTEQFAERMANGPHADTFRVLTHNIDPTKTEFRQLAGAIADTSQLEAFMASYRSRLAVGGLSAIN